MGNKKKQTWETKEQFQGRLVRETIEDTILNDMITHDKQILIDNDKSSKSVYTKSNIDTQASYDNMIYHYFSDKFENLSDKHPRVYEGLDFTNFVKTLTIHDTFMHDLRNIPGLQSESIERIWQDVFNQDTGSFKIAALNGFKRVLEDTGSAVTDTASNVGNINALIEKTNKDIKELGSSLRGEINNSADEMYSIGREVIEALTGDPLDRNNNPLEAYDSGAGSPWDKI